MFIFSNSNKSLIIKLEVTNTEVDLYKLIGVEIESRESSSRQQT